VLRSLGTVVSPVNTSEHARFMMLFLLAGISSKGTMGGAGGGGVVDGG
jgi:hypothetical protein